jgi:ubiquinone/menaquinone biosynthesis C-methylase UbiE
MKKGFFEGQDFGSQKFKALMPEFYPTNYQEYIKQETILLKQKLAGVKTVLEAGVGIGRIIPEIAPLVEEFVGIDNADLMLSEAQKQASKFPNVKIIKGYLESLSTIFPRNHFERSICIA